MKYSLEVTRTFEREFRKLEMQLKRRLDSTIRGLRTNPHLGKPLRGPLSGRWSLRIGDYRIIYAINEQDNKIILLTIRHRKAVYR